MPESIVNPFVTFLLEISAVPVLRYVQPVRYKAQLPLWLTPVQAAALPTQSVRKRRFLGQVVQALRSPIPAQQAGFSTGLEVVEALTIVINHSESNF